MQLLKYQWAHDGEPPQAIKTKHRNIWNAEMVGLELLIYFLPLSSLHIVLAYLE